MIRAELIYCLYIQGKEERPCFLCIFRKRCNSYNFLLNLINTLEACWIGTGPYDITEGQVRVNQGVKDCLQYSRGYKHYLIRS